MSIILSSPTQLLLLNPLEQVPVSVYIPVLHSGIHGIVLYSSKPDTFVEFAERTRACIGDSHKCVVGVTAVLAGQLFQSRTVNGVIIMEAGERHVFRWTDDTPYLVHTTLDGSDHMQISAMGRGFAVRAAKDTPVDEDITRFLQVAKDGESALFDVTYAKFTS